MKIPLSQTGRVAALLSTAAFLLGLGLPSRSNAQTAQFVGAQSTPITGLGFPSPTDVTMDASGNLFYLTTNSVVKATPTVGGYTKTTVVTGLFSPNQIAVDKSGNLYIVEQQTSAQATTGLLYKETLFHGAYTQTTIPIPIKVPLSVAVDSSNRLYVAGAYDGILRLTPSGGTYTQSTIGNGLNNPRYLALDSKGNIYAADTQNNRVVKETLANGAYTQSVIGSGMDFPEGVAVDGTGIVYVSDSGNYRVLRLAPSGNAYVKTTLPINSNWLDNNPYGAGPGGMTVDKSGSLLVTDNLNGQIIKWSPLGADFGQVKTGTTSPVISLRFNFSVAGTLYNIATLTQGMVQSDFAFSPTGTCLPGTFYFADTTCSLDVKFTPKMAGDRNGSVLLHNSTLNTFATGYMHGVGLGAQLQYFPANQTSVTFSNSANSLPYGVAVDGYGTVYIADAQNNRVLKEMLSGPNYVESTVGTGLNTPTGVAVDAGGNIYIADAGNNRVLKETPAPLVGYVQTTIGSSLSGPEGVAVGPDGSVYISDTLHSRVLKETRSGSSYVQTIIPTSGLIHPYGIAVDGLGNVFLADFVSSEVLKLTVSSGVYTQSTLSSVGGIYSVAVDPLGNVYLPIFSSGDILKYIPSGLSYTDVFLPVNGLDSPYAIAVDAWGNPYVTDIGNRQVQRAGFGDAPTRTFASTGVGSTSPDSPKTVMVANYGNLPLNLPVPASGENPSISANFSFVNDAGHPCPIVDSSASTPGVLAVGQSCVMFASFKPTAVGNIAGSLIFTDDALNPTHPGTSHQTVSLTGVGTQVTTQLAWPTPAAITYGTALSAAQLNATASDGGSNSVAGTFVYSPVAGTIVKAGTQVLKANFTPTDAVSYTTASKSVNLKVNKAVLTVTAKSGSRTYGSANPALTYTITGFVNGDTAATAVTGTPALTTTAVAGSPVGSYAITPAVGTLAASNYTFKFVNGTLKINQANLTLTADNASVLYNAPIPTLTWTPTGFVNGDTSAVLSGSPDVSTTAIKGSLPGTFPINIAAGTLTATNYSFTFVNGTFTVTSLGTEPNPKFAPAAGTYAGSVDVTISDTGTGAVIRYTTDGSTPQSTSPIYTVPIHLTASTTVKAVAYGPVGYVHSGSATAVYTVQ